MKHPRILTLDDLTLAIKEISDILGNQDFVIIGTTSIIPALKGKSDLSRSVDVDVIPSKSFLSPEKEK
jgi:hypothetical protein